MKSFGSASASRCCQINQCDSMKNASFTQFLSRSDCWNPSAAFRLLHSTRFRRINVTPAVSEPLVEPLPYLFAGSKIMWEALHDPLVNQLGDTLSSGKLNLPPFQPCWSRARQRSQTAAPHSVSCSSYGLSREDPSRSVWVSDLKLTQQSKMKEGKQEKKEEEKMNKTQRSMRAPPVECVHMCAQGLI